ncbi:hypothetical protein BDA99DRAFT_272570 [Phascolomyces articulosus]|uniref:Cyclin N-terminal domain-containing protein n=1 Tax=Phascolomyces articulosus TaxID=60185 RepID=A0AAD5KNU5_9FUNG|nr:hypothetical protein BDA99DRAFT_272570 [Phascolomyces articulosus]
MKHHHHHTVMHQQERLSDFMERPLSLSFLKYISDQASLVIPCHTTTKTTHTVVPPLSNFINFLVRRSTVGPGTLLAVLVLLDRLRNRLAPIAKGMPCTRQRIFLATLIVTCKLLNDTAPKNRHWTHYAHYFTVEEINLMEKQLLALLDFELSISLNDLYTMLIRFELSHTSTSSMITASSCKKTLVNATNSMIIGTSSIHQHIPGVCGNQRSLRRLPP